MNVLVTGAGGQLGRELVRLLEQQGHSVTAADRRTIDVASLEQYREAASSLKPDAIVHAAAYTQVDRAELDPEAAYLGNAVGARNAAVAASKVGAKLVYVSTDYVFDGCKGSPYHEFDAVQPLNVYGRSKLAGEQLAASLCGRCFVVRTSWLYGPGGNHFVAKIVTAAKQSGELKVIDDQTGTPAYTFDVACFIKELLRTEAYGTYHAANRGVCSRYELAKEALLAVGAREVTLVPVKSDSFVLPAARPQHTALDDMAARLNGLPRLRDWKSALHDYIRRAYREV